MLPLPSLAAAIRGRGVVCSSQVRHNLSSGSQPTPVVDVNRGPVGRTARWRLRPSTSFPALDVCRGRSKRIRSAPGRGKPRTASEAQRVPATALRAPRPRLRPPDGFRSPGVARGRLPLACGSRREEGQRRRAPREAKTHGPSSKLPYLAGAQVTVERPV
jgi:hypothetical protein